MDLVGAILFVLVVVPSALAFLWLEWKAEQRRRREDEEFRRSIGRLPLDVQVRLLSSKLRHDAQKDWF